MHVQYDASMVREGASRCMIVVKARVSASSRVDAQVLCVSTPEWPDLSPRALAVCDGECKVLVCPNFSRFARN